MGPLQQQALEKTWEKKDETYLTCPLITCSVGSFALLACATPLGLHVCLCPGSWDPCRKSTILTSPKHPRMPSCASQFPGRRMDKPQGSLL